MSVQIEKNTVSPENQVKSGYIPVYDCETGSKKILFCGNSITFHGKLSEIGWERDCGMAASSPSCDYVHLLMEKVHGRDSGAGALIAQMADWERGFEDDTVLEKYKWAAEYEADIIIFRLGENISGEMVSRFRLSDKIKLLLEFLNQDKNAKIILSTCFWNYPAVDNEIEIIADKLGLPLVRLGQLGELDEMKAIGLFEHGGVAGHPGDRGMSAIADLLWGKMMYFF